MKKGKFDWYIEMAVNVRDNTAPNLSWDALDEAMDACNVRSSSQVDYDDQKAAWEKVAKKMGVTVEALARFVDKDGKADYGFAGMEGLAVLSGNKSLFGKCDYGRAISGGGSSDQFVTSMFYGGKRAKQWTKYVDKMTVENLIEEFRVNMDVADNVVDVAKTNDKNKVKLSVPDERAKAATLKALERMDKWFDFDVDVNETHDMDGDGNGFVLVTTIKGKK